MKTIISLYLSTLINGTSVGTDQVLIKKELDFYVNSPVTQASEQFKTLEEFKILYFSCTRQLRNNKYPEFCFEIYNLYETLLLKDPTFKTFSQFLDESCLQNKKNSGWHSKLVANNQRRLPAKCLKIKEEYKKMYLYQKTGQI